MEIELIKKWWPLEDISRIKKFSKGVINDSFLVECGVSKYVIRVYKNKQVKDIDFEIKLLQFIKDLPVPKLQFIDNNFIDTINKHPVIIYRYLPGEHVNEYNVEQLQNIGIFLAQFHKQGQAFRYKGERKKFYYFDSDRFARYLNSIKNSDLKYKDRLKEIIEDLKKNKPSSSFQEGPIHIDLKPDNVLFTGGNISGVIDFDNSYIGPYILDLAKTIIWFSIKNGKFNKANGHEILKGYLSKRILPENEIKDLAKMITYGFASHLFVDYYNVINNIIPVSYFEYLMDDFYSSYQSYKNQQLNNLTI